MWIDSVSKGWGYGVKEQHILNMWVIEKDVPNAGLVIAPWLSSLTVSA